MDKIYDVIILGAGPGGLAAGIYAGRARLDTLLIEKGKDGGQIAITDEIENYPGQMVDGESGPSLIERMTKQVEKFGAERVSDTIVSVDIEGPVKTLVGSNGTYKARTLIIATGAFPRPIGCKGEGEFMGKGVSYCATCDAHFYPGKTVAVLGYNAESCREANFLAETAGRLLYFPVVPHEVAVNDHVQVINERPIAILGQTHAEGVQTEQNTYAVDGVFVLRDAVAPDKLVPGLAVEGAHVRVDANMATNLSGCFACGDLAGKPYQYIKAAGQGNVAALSAVEWLAKQKR